MYNNLVTLSFINNLVTLSSVTMFGHINFISLKCYFKSNNGGKKISFTFESIFSMVLFSH